MFPMVIQLDLKLNSSSGKGHLNLFKGVLIVKYIQAHHQLFSLKVICKVVAVWLHYFLLVWFAWMLIEGIYLYLMVITVFDNNNEQLRLYGVCAYGKIADQYVSVLKLIAQYVYLWFMAQLTK